MKPVRSVVPGIANSVGTPSYTTFASNRSPFASGFFGVTMSSCPSRVYVAGLSPTSISRTVIPTKSKSKLQRLWVARAWITALPSRTSVAGSYETFRSYFRTS